MSPASFSNKYKQLSQLFTEWLEAEFSQLKLEGALAEACRGAVMTGGKRLRPVLCMAAAEMLGVAVGRVKPFCLALELLHCSSLVHDDLPALDNDDFRRGQPSCHKRFGEAVAILAGDALLIRSFSVLGTRGTEPEVVGRWLRLLGEAGIDLCNGQLHDLELAGKVVAAAGSTSLEQLCLKKTAALFRAAVLAPLACLDEDESSPRGAHLEIFGTQLGLLFQIQDDITDHSQSVKREGREEPNYVAQFGATGAAEKSAAALEAAVKSLAEFGEKSLFLRQLTETIASSL